MTTAKFLDELQALVTAGKVRLHSLPPANHLIRDERGNCPIVAVARHKAGKEFDGPQAAGEYLKLGLDLYDIKDGSDYPVYLCNQRAKVVREALERMLS